MRTASLSANTKPDALDTVDIMNSRPKAFSVSSWRRALWKQRLQTKSKPTSRDAMKIAKCLAKGSYKSVYVPSDEDNAVKEYIRMRDDMKDSLKRLKQQIVAFYIRNGKSFKNVVGKNYWTNKHMNWLKALEFKHEVLKDTLNEYLILYYVLCKKSILMI